jgi:restriction system protein
VKRYSGNVSNSSVQEVVASKNYYNSDKCMVVTNSYFTNSAVELARANSVELINRDKLFQLIDKYM